MIFTATIVFFLLIVLPKPGDLLLHVWLLLRNTLNFYSISPVVSRNPLPSTTTTKWLLAGDGPSLSQGEVCTEGDVPPCLSV